MATFDLVKGAEKRGGHFSFEGLVDTADTLTVMVRSDKDNRVYHIVFDDCLGYRVMDEGDLLACLPDIGAAVKKSPAALYQTHGTDFEASFRALSCGKYKDDDLKCFCIVTSNQVVDVVSWGGSICVKTPRFLALKELVSRWTKRLKLWC